MLALTNVDKYALSVLVTTHFALTVLITTPIVRTVLINVNTIIASSGLVTTDSYYDSTSDDSYNNQLLYSSLSNWALLRSKYRFHLKCSSPKEVHLLFTSIYYRN